MKEPDPSARVQLRAVNSLQLPGVCAMCGNGTCERGYVDPAIFYDYEGQVYFCMLCAEEMAETFGCLLPEEAEALTEQANALAVDNEALRKELNDANERLAAFDRLIGAAINGGYPATNDGANEQPAEQPSSEPDASGTEPKPEPVKSTPRRPRRNGPARITSSNRTGFSL